MRQRICVRVRPEVIWKEMVKRNLSQNRLASELGVTNGYLSQLVNGRKSPSPDLRIRMLEYFSGMGFVDLFRIEHRSVEGSEPR